MQPSEKGALYQLAEETAYSSKGHYKTADWLNISVALFIFVPLVTSLLALFFELPPLPTRLLGFVGFLFSMFALNSVLANNRDRCNRLIAKHMDLGNRYLELHKEIRNVVNGAYSSEMISEFQKRNSELDSQSNTCHINFIGRHWSRLVIKKEMDLDWIYK